MLIGGVMMPHIHTIITDEEHIIIYYLSGIIMSKKVSKKTLLLALLSTLWVFIPILSSYSTNIGEVSIGFVIQFACACIVGTLVIFSLMTLILRSPFASFAACVIGWFGVSASYSAITGLSRTLWIPLLYVAIPYIIILLILFFGTGFGIKKLMEHYHPNEKNIIKLLSAVVGILLIISIIPIVVYSVQSDIVDSETTVNSANFSINTSLPKPNIYWIHAESMLNERTLEKYWGNETVGFTKTLENKGFFVNPNAEIRGYSETKYALPALMCPNYYDAYEEYYQSEYINDEWNPETKLRSISTISQRNYKYNNELLSAFSKAGYTTYGAMHAPNIYYVGSTSFEDVYLYLPDSVAYSISNNKVDVMGEIGSINNELQFVEYTTYPLYLAIYRLGLHGVYWDYKLEALSPISLPKDYVPKNITTNIMNGTDWLHEPYSGLLNSVSHSLDNAPSPKLVCIYPRAAHMDPSLDEDGNSLALSNPSHDEIVRGYYGQYLFSEKFILYLVETIQEKDPNAIIIIQGDHGPLIRLSENNPEVLKDLFGPSANVIELRNHVLSAIYLPEAYRTENATQILSNPLNIARYLVNNFVGENYQYK